MYLPNIDLDIISVTTKWHLTRNSEGFPSYSQDIAQTFENVFTSTYCSSRISKCAISWEILTAASHRIWDCSKSMEELTVSKVNIYQKNDDTEEQKYSTINKHYQIPFFICVDMYRKVCSRWNIGISLSRLILKL